MVPTSWIVNENHGRDRQTSKGVQRNQPTGGNIVHRVRIAAFTGEEYSENLGNRHLPQLETGRFWPKAAAGIEWRVAAVPPKAAAGLLNC